MTNIETLDVIASILKQLDAKELTNNHALILIKLAMQSCESQQ